MEDKQLGNDVSIEKSLRTQLDFISKRFQGFNQKLQADKSKKIDEHESSFRKIRAGIEHLEEQVKNLTTDRVKALKMLQKVRIGNANEYGEYTIAHVGDEYDKMLEILEKTKQGVNQLKEQHKETWEHVDKLQDDGMNQVKKALEDFQKYYAQVSYDNSKLGDEIVNMLREKDIRYSEAFKEENMKTEKMAIVEKRKIEGLDIERRKMAEEIRRTMEETLLMQVRRIKTEEGVRKQQRDEFLQSVEHFTKRIQHTIKEL